MHGFNTQGENIADNGGLRAALRAYSLFSIRNPTAKKERLPSLEHYSPEQLFFLGFAQVNKLKPIIYKLSFINNTKILFYLSDLVREHNNRSIKIKTCGRSA